MLCSGTIRRFQTIYIELYKTPQYSCIYKLIHFYDMYGIFIALFCVFKKIQSVHGVNTTLAI